MRCDVIGMTSTTFGACQSGRSAGREKRRQGGEVRDPCWFRRSLGRQVPRGFSGAGYRKVGGDAGGKCRKERVDGLKGTELGADQIFKPLTRLVFDFRRALSFDLSRSRLKGRLYEHG